MTKTSIPWLLLVLLLWLISGAWWHSCSRCSDCYAAADTANSPSTAAKPMLTISDQTAADAPTPVAQSSQSLRFIQSNDTPIVGEETQNALQKLVAYLNANPKKSVDVNGYYQANEANASTFENLGLARANQLKQKLVEMGASSNQLTPKGILKNELINQNDTLFGAATLVFVAPMPTPVEGLIAKPFNVYFDNNTADIDQTDALKAYLDQLKTYADKHPNANITITGFTDHVGSPKANLMLSENRATFVKNFMAKKGFDAQRLQIDYKGMENPIASNETTEGRAKNRRVEITIKQ